MPGYKRTLEEYGEIEDAQAKKAKLSEDVSVASKAVRLNIYSKQVFLEQSLRVTDSIDVTRPSLFASIMFTSKQFFCTTKKRSVYKLAINMTTGYTSFGFLNFSSRYFYPFHLSYKKAVMLIKLLEPRQVSMLINLKKNIRSEFLDLLPYLKGKLELEFTHDLDIAPRIIEKEWSKLKLLKCSANELPQTVPPKKFDTLYVHHIQSIGQLQNVLRHDSKTLHLYFDEDFVKGEASTKHIQEVGQIDTCYVNGERSVSLKALQTIVSNCPKIKKLTCNSRFICNSTQQNTVEEIIDDIVENYNIYKDAIRYANQAGIESIVNTTISYSGTNFKLPRNWIDGLLIDSDFLGVHNKTVVSDDKVTTTFLNEQKTDKLNATFHVELYYKYVEDQTFEDLIAQEFQEIFG